MLKQGLIDYLDVLRMAGLEDWGPFEEESISPSSNEETVPVPTDIEPPVPVPHHVSASGPKPQAPVSPAMPTVPRKPAASSKSVKSDPASAQHQLDLLAREVAECRRCAELALERTQTVFGTGNPQARLVFIGEAPGAEEDKQGIPFVGRAGQLLTDIITKGMGLERKDVYICNILRCRPPGNRNPLPDEASRCREFLDRTLEIVAPEFLCCLGAVAAQNLLATDTTIGKLRGKVQHYQGIPVVCTYHPAYLLRNPSAKKETWKDIQFLMKLMGLPITKGKE